MIISVHQPHFLPWIGYINKIMNSEVFVVLDTVQYRKNYYQNRVLIKNHDGTPFWLSVPVKRAHLETPICEIVISGKEWKKKATKTIESIYSKTPFFHELYPSLYEIIMCDFNKLSHLNIALLKWLMEKLDIKTKIHIASDLGIHSNNPNDRLIKICKHFNASCYIAGKGGRNYLDERLFNGNGIKVIYQVFNPSETIYRQINGDFLPGLSVIDLLFNEGSDRSHDIIKNTWKANV